MSKISKTFQYGAHPVIIETGEIARQATGAVLVKMGDTTVLVTVVGAKEAVEGRDFFPLTVNYQERTYAAGKIPGGFIKREGRPSEKEVLTSRLIDRPLRPLFPKQFFNEVQVIATVMSIDPEIDPDIPAMIGASAALAISGIPFHGPIGAARVGHINGVFTLNPTLSELQNSGLNLVVAGTEDAVLMVESEAKELSEDIMLEAVFYGHSQMQTVIKAVNELAAEAGNPAWEWEPPASDENLIQQVTDLVKTPLGDAYRIQEKPARYARIDEIRSEAVSQLCGDDDGNAPTERNVVDIFADVERKIVRSRILAGEQRIDGRDHETVRPISIDLNALTRTHGSAIFTRGETQAMVIITLGTARDAQIIDALEGERKEHFMLHYNFPPYCVGETGMMGSPKRREIGHGKLAKRAIQALLPSQDDFPYVLRVVSEITESNGSSSMATVCGTSLALMDAGVPIKDAVAGIAMGLIKEGDQFSVLTDILGDEDHLGDMDFKVAGTKNGVTALQMDIKIRGITKEIMKIALHQANKGRLHILNIMDQVITKPREKMSEYAPRIVSFKIPVDKIRDVIGKGGATIRGLTEQTGASIDIDDDGTIKIYATENKAAEDAQRQIEQLTANVEIGTIYEGKVVKITDFGAFVSILNDKQGLVHISQISHEHVNKVTDVLKEGQMVTVKVLDIDNQGRIRLSMKAALKETTETN